MSVGASILSLLGNEDPRVGLLRSMTGQQQPADGVQYAGAQAPAPGTTAQAPAGGAGAPVTPQFDSPPDLSALYESLIKYQGREQNLNRGMGLIGSAISQDQNRANTLGAFLGNDGGISGRVEDVAKLAGSSQDLLKADVARQQRAAALAALPGIARRYGLDLATATMLYDQGKLEEVIAEREKPNTELVTDAATGQNLLIDRTAGVQRGAFGGEKDTTSVKEGPNGTLLLFNDKDDSLSPLTGPDTMTPETREYDRYVVDERSRNNNNPLSYQQWRMTKPPSTQITNNVGGEKMDPAQKRFAEKSSDFFAEDYQTYRKARNQARDMLNQYDLAKEALDTNVKTGTFGETEQYLRKLAVSIGIGDEESVNKVAGGELLKTVTNRMALLMRNPDSGMGMPGSVSDRDLTFLKEAQVSLGTSNPRAMIEAFERIERRKIEIADLADAYVKKHGMLDAGFDAEVRAFADKNSLFEDFEITPKDPVARKNEIFKQYGINN